MTATERATLRQLYNFHGMPGFFYLRSPIWMLLLHLILRRRYMIPRFSCPRFSAVHVNILTNTQAKDIVFTMEQLVEAAFLIPIREDRDVGNGATPLYTMATVDQRPVPHV